MDRHITISHFDGGMLLDAGAAFCPAPCKPACRDNKRKMRKPSTPKFPQHAKKGGRTMVHSYSTSSPASRCTRCPPSDGSPCSATACSQSSTPQGQMLKVRSCTLVQLYNVASPDLYHTCCRLIGADHTVLDCLIQELSDVTQICIGPPKLIAHHACIHIIVHQEVTGCPDFQSLYSCVFGVQAEAASPVQQPPGPPT